ncbi:glycoside hydrolase family 88 protein [Aspergillus stella-maris]|uniref:glycoside hydrolase family 88 protein n=1 Tax=Aspergillus stella-maris TaxID=1810926 RepID=UPI003CCD0782
MEHEQVLLQEIFSESVFAKVLRVAVEALENNTPPTVYPEFVPQNGADKGLYFLRDANFWTCGFFPGILYLLRERAVRFPQVFPYRHHTTTSLSAPPTSTLRQLTLLCEKWTAPIKEMATRTDTHDMSFILQPSLRRDWELTSNPESLQYILTGARSLASRFVPSAGAIRSWDALVQSDVLITSLEDDCLVIIDSMMNLDLLYYASAHVSDSKLATIATTHAHTVRRSLLRSEPASPGFNDKKSFKGQLYSTYHVVNFDPKTGSIKEHRTAQGYDADSTWARGQAWATYGFAQTYQWTKDPEFLSIACGLAEYFIQRLETSPACVEKSAIKTSSSTSAFVAGGALSRAIGRYVPLWDFDAPIEDEANPLRDSSAGVIAANGMLLLSQALTAQGDDALACRYRRMAIRIVTDTIEFSLADDRAIIATDGESAPVRVEDAVPGRRFDAILKNATANHNSQDNDRYSDHGLVYADYYLLEFGNQLLKIGLF